MEIQKLDKLGLEFLAAREGFELAPYLDTSGIPTIGVGFTYYPDTGKRVTMHDPPLTKAQVLRLFALMVPTYEKAVWSVTRDDITQNQFNALVSLCYRIGPGEFKRSTLLRRVNQRASAALIREAFLMWRYDNGKPILLPRAKLEAALYAS